MTTARILAIQEWDRERMSDVNLVASNQECTDLLARLDALPEPAGDEVERMKEALDKELYSFGVFPSGPYAEQLAKVALSVQRERDRRVIALAQRLAALGAVAVGPGLTEFDACEFEEKSRALVALLEGGGK